MEFTAAEILKRMKGELKNNDTRIEGSFSMDNLQAVAEELARYNTMLIKPLWNEIDAKIEEVITSGNENHYVFWAKQAVDGDGKKIVGNARASGVRDGSGEVYLALITPQATVPTEEEVAIVKAYIEERRPVGAKPIICAAEAVEVTINGNVELMEGAELLSVKAQIQEKIQEYLAAVAFEGNNNSVLNYHRIGMIIGNTQGVREVVDYKVNGGSVSIEADYSQFFTLKELVLHAV